jgi:hypothetical protein
MAGMPSRLRHRVSSAHLIALVALFAALGGGAYAAIKLPRNSVGSAQIRKGAVTPAKLSKAAKAKLAGPAGPAGAKGDAGATGAAGAAGATGATGPSDVYAAGASFGALTASYTQIAAITVPAGSYLLQAKATAYGHVVNAAASADCIIAPTVAGGAGTWDEASLTTPAIAGVTAGGVISLLGADVFGAQQTVILACKTLFGSADYDDARVVATRTGAAHGTPLPID